MNFVGLEGAVSTSISSSEKPAGDGVGRLVGAVIRDEASHAGRTGG